MPRELQCDRVPHRRLSEVGLVSKQDSRARLSHELQRLVEMSMAAYEKDAVTRK
jgi:hypothetical protein